MEELDKNKSGNPMEGEARGTMSIEEFLKKDEQKDLLRFLTAGSVDDGKSTLIGRLLLTVRNCMKTSSTRWNVTVREWEMPENTSTMLCCWMD